VLRDTSLEEIGRSRTVQPMPHKLMTLTRAPASMLTYKRHKRYQIERIVPNLQVEMVLRRTPNPALGDNASYSTSSDITQPPDRIVLKKSDEAESRRMSRGRKRGKGKFGETWGDARGVSSVLGNMIELTGYGIVSMIVPCLALVKCSALSTSAQYSQYASLRRARRVRSLSVTLVTLLYTLQARREDTRRSKTNQPWRCGDCVSTPRKGALQRRNNFRSPQASLMCVSIICFRQQSQMPGRLVQSGSHFSQCMR
jgi:hypothetical protein